MEQILLAKRRQLSERIAAKINEHSNLSSHRTHDTTDAAADAVDKELALLVAEAETRERAKIDEALEKVAEGSYGRCEGCSKLIPLARLKVLPFASLCIQCKELEEQQGNGYF